MRFRLRVLRHFASILLLLTVSATAAEKKVARPTTMHLTLQKAIEMALAKNFTLQVQRFEPQIARERVTQELGRFDPVFDFTADRSEDTVRDFLLPRSRSSRNPASAADINANVFSGLEHFAGSDVVQTSRLSSGIGGISSWGTEYDLRLTARDNDPLNGFQQRNTTDASLGIVQPLLQGFGPDANLAQLRIARNNVLVSEWQLRQRIIDVITDTVVTYNNLHLAHENFKVARGFRDLALQTVNDNSKRVEIGVMSPLNITTARAEAAQREEAVIVAAARISDNQNFLKQLITSDLEGLLDVRLEIEPPPRPTFVYDVRAGIADALQLRPDYRQAILEIERRHITLSFTKNNALPRFDLSASLHLLGIDNDFGTSASRVARRDESAWTVGAIFSVPLPNREGRGSVAAAKLGAAQALVSLQKLEQDIVVIVDNAAKSVNTARERIKSNGEARVLAKESLDAGEERLRAGTGTTFEVLELQRNLAETEAAEISAYSDFNKAVTLYYSEIGSTLREYRVQIDPPQP